MKSKIVVVGSHAPGILIHVHRPPIAGETVIGWGYEEPRDGGKGTLQAIAAARFGASVGFVGKFGRDRLGETGARWLEEEGIDTSCLFWSEREGTGAGFIILDEAGIPAMITSPGANAELGRNDIEAAEDLIASADVLLTQFEIPVETALYAAAIARLHGVKAIINPAPAPGNGKVDLTAADILTPNESEAAALLGLKDEAQLIDPLEIARRLQSVFKIRTVVITLGEQGIAIADGDDAYLIPAPSVTVADTSGAGDAFNAALAVGLGEGRTLQSAAQWACASASLSVTRAGTIDSYPSRQEIEDFFHLFRDEE